MKSPTWKTQTIASDNQFSYVLSFEEEDSSAKDHFINFCGWSNEEYSEIKDFYWFTAKITAFKGDEPLADTYLGGNCYKSLKDVLGDGEQESILGGYAPQMIEEVKEEAEIMLANRIEVLENTLSKLKA